MIIGLTGRYAAGKGTVAARLVDLGFSYHSLSDVIREQLADRGIPESRAALLAMGNQLRKDGGPEVLATMIRDRLTTGDHIVDSIRNPAEVVELRLLPDFWLLGVDAEARIRYDRLRSRGRQGDPETWESFVELESREVVSADPRAQQLAATFDLADHVVQNDAGVDALEAAVDSYLASLRGDPS